MHYLSRLVPIFSAILFYINFGHAATINLSGEDATGYLSIATINTEPAEPNEVGFPDNPLKHYDYPYYENVNLPGFTWDVIVAEPLSASSVYAQSEQFEIKNATITDDDFNRFNLGSIIFGLQS